MRVVRRFLQLTWSERWLLARAAVYVLVARARQGDELSTRRALGRTRRRSLRQTSPQTLARAVAVVSRYLRPSCLERSLALFRLLRAEGLEATLRIGVRAEGEGLAAHAWVEHEGVPLLDEETNGFVAFDAPILASE